MVAPLLIHISPVIIQTKRLQLIPFNAEDSAALLLLFQSPTIRQYLCDGHIVNAGWMGGCITSSIDNFSANQLGMWSVRMLDMPHIIGFAGFTKIGDNEELMFGLDKDAMGQGYATEAVQAVIAERFHIGADAIIAGADAPNLPSHKLLQKLGFMETHRTLGAFGDVIYYELSRQQYS
jgi:[ribosomal protein S5]-alanine N-acetyltransferase